MLPALLPLPLAAVGEMECEDGAPSGPLPAPHPCGVLILLEVGSAVAELSRSDPPPAWAPEMQLISTYFIYKSKPLSLTKTIEKKEDVSISHSNFQPCTPSYFYLR